MKMSGYKRNLFARAKRPARNRPPRRFPIDDIPMDLLRIIFAMAGPPRSPVDVLAQQIRRNRRPFNRGNAKKRQRR